MRPWIVLVLLAACDVDEGTKYGTPSGLERDNLPKPPESGAPPVDASCAAADGSACAVRWSTDVWPLMSASGPWKCADASCHGGGATSPPINDAEQAYAALAAFKGIGNKPYVLPCSTDPVASTFLCNLQGTCGKRMPLENAMIGSRLANATEIGLVTTWITQCGAPKN